MKLDAKGLCGNCYSMNTHCCICVSGKSTTVYTNGVTEEIRPLIPMIKNKVLEDCIKNPGKYLYGEEK